MLFESRPEDIEDAPFNDSQGSAANQMPLLRVRRTFSPHLPPLNLAKGEPTAVEIGPIQTIFTLQAVFAANRPEVVGCAGCEGSSGDPELHDITIFFIPYRVNTPPLVANSCFLGRDTS